MSADEKCLLGEYVAERSDDAFAALVALHLNLVFSTALRQVGNRALAEEVTQAVFLALAQKAPKLKGNATLAGWLYRTTVNQARQSLRGEGRRANRESIAAALGALEAEGESLARSVAPLLDEALLSLREKDRLALTLHYFEERPLREVGALLGVGEDAARKRVQRTMAFLCDWFRKRGFAVSSATLLPILGSTQAAPAGLIQSIVTAAASVPIAAPSVATSILLMTTTKKLAIGAAVLALAIALGTYYVRPPARSLVQGPLTNPATVNVETPVTTIPETNALSATTDPAAAVPRVKTFYERLNDGDMSLTMLPREQAEAYLERGKTNAQSLIAAYRVTHDLTYLRQAAEKFPNDPAVLLRVVAHDAIPENRRAWIEQFKQADPNNSLPLYLSAADHLKRNEFEAALQELERAGQKPQFQDYLTEHMLALEEIYLASGHSAAEAKALGMSAVEMPYVPQMGEMSNRLIEQLKGFRQSGDQANVEKVATVGLQLANAFNGVHDGGNLLGEIVSTVMEQRILKQLDPAGTYPFLNGTIPERLEAGAAREKEIREAGRLFSNWITRASEPEIVSYFDRLKLYGETGALQWLKERAAP